MALFAVTGEAAVATKIPGTVGFEHVVDYDPELLKPTPPTADDEWSPCAFDDKKWSSHNPECFRIITNENYDEIKGQIGTKGAVFAKYITPKDIAACRSLECWYLIAELLTGVIKNAKIPQASLSVIDTFQMNMLLGARLLVAKKANVAWDSKTYYAFLDSFKADDLARHGRTILSSMKKLAAGGRAYLAVHDVKESVIAALLSRPENCGQLDGTILGSLLGNGKAKTITPACVRRVSALADAKPTKLSGVPATFLSETNVAISEELTKILDSEKLKNVASEIPPSKLPGQHLDFTKLKSETVAEGSNPSLRSKLVVGKLNSLPASAPIFSATTDSVAGKFKGDYFKDVSVEDGVTALGKLSSDDLSRMKPEALKTLMTTAPAVCANLPVRSFKDVSLTDRRCIEKAPPKVQAAIMLTAKELPDDIAAGITNAMFSDWSAEKAISTSCKEDCNRLGVLEHMVARPNNPAIIANLGLDASGPSACEALGTIEDLSPYGKVCTSINPHCFNATSSHDFEGVAKVHPRLRTLVPFRTLRKDEAFLKSLTADLMRHFSANMEFCRTVDLAAFNLFPLVSLSGLSGSCLAQMSFRGELSAKTLAALDKDVYMTVPSDKITANMLAAMTEGQIATACTKAADEAHNNLGSALTDTVLTSLGVDKVGHITSTQWKAVAPAAFKAITGAYLKVIKGANMAEWTIEQVREVDPSVWPELSAEQAALIGTKTAPEHSPVKHLSEASGLSDEIREILRKNIPATAPPAEEGTSYTMVIIIVAIIVGVLLLGGAIYFFMSR